MIYCLANIALGLLYVVIMILPTLLYLRIYTPVNNSRENVKVALFQATRYKLYVLSKYLIQYSSLMA